MMIKTATYKLYGQLEELAEGNVDIDAFRSAIKADGST